VVVELLGAIEVDALLFTQQGVYLDWGTVNGDSLSIDALRWVGHYLIEDIVEAVHDACAA